MKLARALAPVLLVGLTCLTGCLDYDEVLTIAADGSGSLVIDGTFNFAFIERIKKLAPAEDAGEDAGDWKDLFNKASIRRDCEAEGVTIKTCEVKEQASTTAVKLALEFKSLAALRSVKLFSDRKLAFADAGGDLAVATYEFDARSVLGALGLGPSPDPAAETDLEKKMRAILDEARKESRTRFTIKLPAKIERTSGRVLENDEKTARWLTDKSDPKGQEALAREALVMTAHVKKSGVPFWEKDAAAAKAKASETPAPPAPAKDPAPTPAPKRPGGLGD